MAGLSIFHSFAKSEMFALSRLALAGLFCISLNAAAFAKSDHRARCRGADPDARIAGCTEIIARGSKETKRNQITAYINRAGAYHSGRVELVAGLALPDAQGQRAPLTVKRDSATVVVLAREASVAMATGSALQPKSEAARSRQERPTEHVEEHWTWEAGLGETAAWIAWSPRIARVTLQTRRTRRELTSRLSRS